MAGGAILWPNLQPFQVVPSHGKTDPAICTLKWSTNLRKFWKSENADLNEIQICFPEIVQIWKGEIFEQLSQNLTLTESRPCWHVSWFWFLLEEVGCVHAHPWLQGQVHHQRYSPKMTSFITRLIFRTGRIVFSSRRTCVLPPRHHGSGRQLHQSLQDSWLPLLQWQEGWQQCGEEKCCIIYVHVDINIQQPAPPSQATTTSHHNRVAVSDDQLGKVVHW